MIISTIVGLVRLFILLAVAVPARAQGKFDIRERGAKGDGLSRDTVAIQKALDDCAAGGGGTVTFPPGRYVSGTIARSA